jgi:hypothetical protein
MSHHRAAHEGLAVLHTLLDRMSTVERLSLADFEVAGRTFRKAAADSAGRCCGVDSILYSCQVPTHSDMSTQTPGLKRLSLVVTKIDVATVLVCMLGLTS